MRRPGDQRRVVAGYHQDSLRSVNMRVWNWRGLDVINAHERGPAVCLDGMRRARLEPKNATSRPRASRISSPGRKNEHTPQRRSQELLAHVEEARARVRGQRRAQASPGR